MPLFDTIPTNYNEAVESLARWHAESFDFPVRIFAVPDDQREQVRLIEVSDHFPKPGPALPIPLGRSATFPFRSAVALATEADWKQIRAGHLKYPATWNISEAYLVWPVP